MSNTVKGWLCAIAGMVTMGVSHLCYSIIIILMASMVAAVGCSAAEGALIFSITAIGSLVGIAFHWVSAQGAQDEVRLCHWRNSPGRAAGDHGVFHQSHARLRHGIFVWHRQQVLRCDDSSD